MQKLAGRLGFAFFFHDKLQMHMWSKSWSPDMKFMCLIMKQMEVLVCSIFLAFTWLWQGNHGIWAFAIQLNVRYSRSRNNGVGNCENMFTVSIGQAWLAEKITWKNVKIFRQWMHLLWGSLLACVICFLKYFLKLYGCPTIAKLWEKFSTNGKFELGLGVPSMERFQCVNKTIQEKFTSKEDLLCWDKVFHRWKHF